MSFYQILINLFPSPVVPPPEKVGYRLLFKYDQQNLTVPVPVTCSSIRNHSLYACNFQ
ncbi:MAG: hypothetical protein ACFFA3_20655 [Promethearchaeota archaeon]